MTTEERTANTILERPVTVVLGGEKYEVAPPTLATLIYVSSEVSKMPAVEKGGDILETVLSTAKDCKAISRILAVLIMGYVKAIQPVRRTLMEVLRCEPVVNKGTLFAAYLSIHASPKEAEEALITILQNMEVEHFFTVTTFLGGLNITKATKVEHAPTVPGRK